MSDAASPATPPEHLFEPREDDTPGFLEHWQAISKRKWAILAFALATTLLAGVVAFVMTPIYRATTTVLIEPNKQNVVGNIADVYNGIGASREHYQTQVEILRSREVALRAITDLKLYDRPEFDPRAPKKGLAAMLNALGFATAETPAEWTDRALAEAVLPAFRGQLAIEPVRLSQLVTVSFESADPAFAATVANKVAAAYIENDLDARYEMTRQASTWLQGRLTTLKEKLNESEEALQSYREKKGIADVKGASQSGAGEAIQQLTMQLVSARARRVEAENAYKAIRGAADKGDLSSLPAVLRSPMVAEARRQEAEADRKMGEIAQRYGKVHPKYVQAEGELATARDNVRRQTDVVVAGITQEYEAARGTEKALESTLAGARSTVVNLNRQEFGLAVLEREADSNRQMFDMFMRRAKETNVAGDLQTTVARIVDPASTPATPVKPRKGLVVAIALAAGLAIGLLAALLLDFLDNTLRRGEDVEARLHQPLLSVLPKFNARDMSGGGATPMLAAPNSAYAEAVRTARTGVLLSSVDLAKRQLLVTSSVPGEGKTTFSINLALAHAHTQKTLLVDADLRRPAVGRAFGLEPTAAGLTDLVAGTAKLGDCLHRIADTSLVCLPAGAMPPNPLELLHSDRFQQTLAALANHFDVIVIDSPPVELVSDALVLAQQASGVIFVVKAASTSHPLARKSLQRLRRANASLIGVVLNAYDQRDAARYYGDYASYGGYGNQPYGGDAAAAGPQGRA
jgi:capsular exopolysaccharide synthesis family protein